MTNRLLVRGLWRQPAWAVMVLFVLAGADLMGQINRIASVAYVDGQVEILRYGSEVPMQAEIGMTLLPGDQIKTRNGKCQLNVTTSGIIRLAQGEILLFPSQNGPAKGSMVLKMLVGKTAKNFRQLAGLDPDEVFEVRGAGPDPDYWVPAPPEVVAQRAKEDQERLAAGRNRAPAPQQPSGNSDEQAVAEYRSLLPAVLQKERKPWHTRFEFLANAVKSGAGYRVAYKTYCIIDKGPDTGKDYACYELDTMLDIGAVKSAVVDMKRRLGR
jgi:hypothetical protein